MYIGHVHQLCGNRITRSCHDKAVVFMNSPVATNIYDSTKDNKDHSEFEKSVKRCISDSFEAEKGVPYDPEVDDNKILRKMLKDWTDYGHHIYPSVVINDVTFRGQMSPFNVFEAICAGFKDLPENCAEWLKEKDMGTPHIEEIIKKKGIRRSHFIKIIVGLVGFNIIFVYLYKKRLN